MDEHLAALRALYARADALFEGSACDRSTECCRFGITGREPYPTAIELLALTRAMRARPPKKGAAKKGRLAVVDDERRCPLLGDDGGCRVYADRPFGCRTFFCDRRTGPKAPSRAAVAELTRAIADLSARAFPRDPGPRPLTRALDAEARLAGRSKRP